MTKQNTGTALVPFSQATDLVAVTIKGELEVIENPVLARRVRKHASDIYDIAKRRYSDNDTAAASFAGGVVQLMGEHPKSVVDTELLRQYPALTTVEIDNILRFAEEVGIDFHDAKRWLDMFDIDAFDTEDEIDIAIEDCQRILDAMPKKIMGASNLSKFDRLNYALELVTSRQPVEITSLTDLADYCSALRKTEW